MTELTLKVVKCPSNDLALTNMIFLSPSDAARMQPKRSVVPLGVTTYAQIGEYVYIYAGHKGVENGFVALNGSQRANCYLSFNQETIVRAFSVDWEAAFATRFVLEVSIAGARSASAAPALLKMADISKSLVSSMLNHFLCVGQTFACDVNGSTAMFRVQDFTASTLQEITGAQNAPGGVPSGSPSVRGAIFLKNTDLLVTPSPGANVRIEGGGEGSAPPIFRPEWNFDQMGIGGLDKEFSNIFRRAFASRIFPNDVIKKLGIKHCKGILLYGPPGTGKTLTARQIGKMLNGKPPKIVRGPEILDKFVGGSEEKVRALFKEAEAEYALKGDQSDLHIIILDELDAICGQRGTRSGSTGVMDTVVNQFLASIDGVEELNNILIIGMTNRKDLIDEALLRPGRLEIQVEIGLPDETGRLQILRIHTARQRENNRLGPDVDLEWIAAHTKNFTGADIQGLVGSAASFAMNRHIDVKNPTQPIDPDQVVLTLADFQGALKEVQPSLGVSDDELAKLVPNGIIPFGTEFERVREACRAFVLQVRESQRTPLLTLLLAGAPGCGKTALASHVALESLYPFAKILKAESLIGYSENAKIARIRKIFDDAWKSPLSVLVLDDLERIVEYVGIGPRFSNPILQTLMVLLREPPPPGRRLLVIGTTGNKPALEDMDLMQVFNAVQLIPNVSSGEECSLVLRELKVLDSPDFLDPMIPRFAVPTPIKKLIMVSEIANQAEETPQRLSRFFEYI